MSAFRKPLEDDQAPEHGRAHEKRDTVTHFRRREKESHEPDPPHPHMESSMPDAPTRPEIAAQLEAAEARTETRIVQLTASIEARGAASDHKIDLLIGKLETLMEIVSEVKADSKVTRNTIWGVGIGAVIAVLGLVVALWIAGINVQASMIAVFQAGLGVRSLTPVSEAPKASPPSTPPPPAAPPGTPGKP